MLVESDSRAQLQLQRVHLAVVGLVIVSERVKNPVKNQIADFDRSFVKGIPADGDDAAIATAIIAMAHKLHLNVVAEGVETADQLAYLRSQLSQTAVEDV